MYVMCLQEFIGCTAASELGGLCVGNDQCGADTSAAALNNCGNYTLYRVTPLMLDGESRASSHGHQQALVETGGNWPY
eukprot:1177042-Prorocentrum_minimum.AAC.3